MEMAYEQQTEAEERRSEAEAQAEEAREHAEEVRERVQAANEAVQMAFEDSESNHLEMHIPTPPVTVRVPVAPTPPVAPVSPTTPASPATPAPRARAAVAPVTPVTPAPPMFAPAPVGVVLISGFEVGAELPDGRWLVMRQGRNWAELGWIGRAALIIGGALTVVSILAILFARRLTLPIRSFSNAVQAVGVDPQSAPVLEEGPQELRGAARAVNTMQARLRALIADRTKTLAGQVDMSFPTLSAALPHIKAGTLRALAVTDTTRSSLLPDVPTMQQAGVRDFQFTQWLALLAPAHTPREVVMRLSDGLRNALNSRELVVKFAQQGFDSYVATPDETGRFIASEVQRFGKLIKSRKITAE